MTIEPAGIPTAGPDMTVAEVAVATGLSTTFIYREIDRGNLVAYKPGGVIRIERAAYADWKRRNRVRPRSEPPIYEVGRVKARSGGASTGFAARLAEVETKRKDAA